MTNPAPASEVIPFPSKSHKIVTLKVTLSDSTPLIWRRIEVPSSLSLADMHFVIQIIMGWEDCHMHCFTVGKRTFSIPLEHGDDEPDIENSLDFTLDSLGLLKPGTKFNYIYDFGDNWKHEVLVEGVSDPVKGNLYPRCIKAVRACPPEDSGGPFGYKRMLQILKKKNHSEHDEIMEYLGEDFDPNIVDIDEINMYLADG